MQLICEGRERIFFGEPKDKNIGVFLEKSQKTRFFNLKKEKRPQSEKPGARAGLG
jgi:hypothetical protein